MQLKINRFQRIVLIVVAGAVILFQLVLIAEEGLERTGWVISFTVAGALLFLSLHGVGQKRNEKKSELLKHKKDQKSNLNGLASALVEIVAFQGSEFDKFAKRNNLIPTDPLVLMVSPPMSECLYVGYSMTYLAIRETLKVDAARLEFMVLRNKMLKGLLISAMDSFASIGTQAGLSRDDAIDALRGDKSISRDQQALAAKRLKRIEQACDEVVLEHADGERPFLLPIYKEFAPYFGKMASDEELEARFGEIFDRLIRSARDNVWGLYRGAET